MDGLSGAASGIAVVSIAIQLADSIKKLYEFWTSVQDAPEDIRAIVKELRLLSAVLDGIKLNEQRYGPDPTTTIVLESCTDKVTALVGLVDDLEPGFASTSRRHRKWSAFKMTLRSEKIKKLRVSLEETKATLILAQQISSDRVTGITFDTQQRNLLEIMHGIAGLQMRRSSRTVTTVSSGPADIDGHIEDLRAETRRISRTVTNPILRSGLEMGMNNAYEGLKRHLGTQSSKDSHWVAQQTVVNDEGLPITEEYDEESEEGVSPVLEKGRRATSAIKRPNQKRSRFRYVVNEYSSSTENVLGRIQFRTKTFHLQSHWSADLDACPTDDQYEFETSFTLHPAQWLLRCGVNLGVRVAVARSIQGWKQKLETYRAVPDDSLIFAYCRDGNLDGARSLFSNGGASVHDTRSDGWTPLHWAAVFCHPQLCKLLLDSGADPDVRENHSRRSPVELVSWPMVKNSAQDITATLPIFNDNIDFSEEDGNGWFTLKEVCSNEPEVIAWAFTYFLSDIIQSSFGHEIVNLLARLSSNTDPASVKLVEKTLNLDSDMVNATSTIYRHPALYNALWVNGDGSMIRALMMRGANPHLAGHYIYEENQVLMTPTSVAIRQSYRFFQWRKVLIELGLDLEVFVKKELQQAPLVIAGWAEDTLLALFAYEFQPCDPPGENMCAQCNKHIWNGGRREIWWEEMLEKIRGHKKLNAESEVLEAPLWECQRSCRRCHEPEENIYHSGGEKFCLYCHKPGDDAYHKQGERVCRWCHQPGDNQYHRQFEREWGWGKGQRSCGFCEWKLHHPRMSLLLDDNWDDEQSSDEEYSPFLIHT